MDNKRLFYFIYSVNCSSQLSDCLVHRLTQLANQMTAGS